MLRQWTNQNAYRGDKSATHVMLDGGSFHVTPAKYPEFVEVFRDCVESNEPVFVCENIAPDDVIRMYCDFDYVGPEALSPEKIQEWTLTAAAVVERVFGEPKNVRVAWVPSTPIPGEETKFKTGAHFVWTDVYLTPPEAASVAGLIRDQFTDKYPGTDWAGVVDIGVYSSGLRMIGSRKVEWRTKKVVGDRVDKKRVRVDAGRAYVPVVRGRVRGDKLEVFQVKAASMHKWILATAIRTYAEVPRTPLKVELPKPAEMRGARATDPVTDPATLELVRRVIAKSLRSEWHAAVRGVEKADNGLLLVKTESMFCENVERDHNSCGVYLVISPTEIWQKCFCRCDTTRGRLHGLCRDYSSKRRKIPPTLAAKLFPPKSCIIEDDPDPVPAGPAPKPRHQPNKPIKPKTAKVSRPSLRRAV